MILRLSLAFTSALCLILAVLLYRTIPKPGLAQENGIERLMGLHIDKLDLNEATFEEGIAIIRAAWDTRHPDASFPVMVEQTPEAQNGTPPSITMSLKNVPAFTAITYLAQINSLKVSHELDMVVLRPVKGWGPSGWPTQEWEISASAAQALGLQMGVRGDEAINAALAKKLQTFGVEHVHLGEGRLSVSWQSPYIIARSTPEGIAKIQGILALLDAGYIPVKREEAPPF